ncbi:MAG: response regulator [Acidobacteriaceae bacterium]|nr:response regulator [Acidobacteriaceae bacterium]
MQSEERVNTIMFVTGRKPESIVDEELQRRGLNVKWANSIKAATDLLESSSERTGIITELALTDGNWRDLVESVRDVSTSIPVVLMTSTSTAELWWDALDCDVEDILTTPLSASRLCEVLGADS